MDVDSATRTMIDNLPAKTGGSLEQWWGVLDAAGPLPHAQAMAVLKSQHGMSHGYANLVVGLHRRRDEGAQTGDELIAAQYAGAKAALRPIYDRVVAAALGFGDGIEVAPKKTGVSLRRSKQFALVAAPSATRVQVGLNLRGAEPTERLRATTGMCTHRVDLRSPDDVDDELVGWLREAYARA